MRPCPERYIGRGRLRRQFRSGLVLDVMPPAGLVVPHAGIHRRESIGRSRAIAIRRVRVLRRLAATDTYAECNVHTVPLSEPKSEAVPNAFLVKTMVHLLQSKKLGIVPAMCDELTNLRKEWKRKLKQATPGSIQYAQASAAEKAVKMLNNSVYGQLGSYRVNPHLGSRQLARCVTAMGRYHLLEVAKVVKKHGLTQATEER